MLLIVAHHYVVNSGLMPMVAGDYPSVKSIFLLLFGWAGKTGIDCFVFITGYFMCVSQITFRKGLKLLLWVEFYNVVLLCVFVAMGYINLSYGTICKGLMPILEVKDGFVSCYLIFFCFIPFLNILIRGMSPKQHLILVFLCLIVFSVFPQLRIHVVQNYVGWFMVVYLVASYFKLYPPRWSLSKKYTGLVLIALIFLSFVGVLMGGELFLYSGKRSLFYFFVADANKPLAIATATAAFLFFNNLKIGYNKIINTIAASAFGVLLIHANSDAMRQWLWHDVLDNVGHYSGNICLHAVFSVVVIYVVCTLVDFARIQLLEKPFFKWFDNRHPTDRSGSIAEKL